MRLNLYLRGIDLIDVEFHLGSKGLYIDLNVFKPRADDPEAEDAPESPSQPGIQGGEAHNFERLERDVWEDDHPAVVKAFGFQVSRRLRGNGSGWKEE